jgi:transposase InsO family protein
MHHDKSLFTNYHRFKHRLYVGGIGSGLLAVGVGNVRITDPNGKVRVLEGVLYVPRLKTGLMALNQLALLGWTSIIQKDGCTVSEGDFSIHSEIRNGLCVWSQTPDVAWSQTPRVPHNADALFAGAAPKKLSLTDWHERLGHVSKDTLAKFGDSAIEDLHLGLVENISEDQAHPCKPCIHGKQHRLPFPSRTGRRGKPLELVYSDLCESNVESIGGGKHVLTFTDDHTNHGMVYILKNKSSSTVLNAFKEYQAWAERQSGHKIKELRTDRGTEYMGDMINHVKSQGIEHNPTAGYSPQSNGVAERMNRTLFEMACTMLDASGAPLELWADAVLTACHIRNRLPSRTLDGKSPYEAWNGRKPTVGHIRKWGCKVYRLINKKTGRKKFQKDFKSMEGYLVGYELPGGVNYRIYHPGTKEFKVSRDVLFDEREFFGTRHVAGYSEEILPSAENSAEDNADQEAEHEEEVEQQNENATPIVYDEIVVEPPPPSSPLSNPSAEPATTPPKRSNRRTRRMIAKAFKAVVKGNWKWPRNFHEAMAAEDSEHWKVAIQKEYDSIIKNGTWTLVPRPKNAKVVKSRWVLRIKDTGLHKARFCAKGFTQRWGEDYDETFAPVAKYTSIRTLFALLAGRKNSKIHQMDVNTAFLNSDIEETVYVEQPEGYEVPGKEDFVCLLRKTLYGLKQSPRAWFQLIASVLVDFDFQQCESDPCIFIHKNDKGEQTYIALYVDDLLIAGDNDEDIATIKRRLSERFEMKDLGIASKFLGMEIEYGEDGSIKIHQNQYIRQLLERHGMHDCSPVTTPMDTSVKLAAINASTEAAGDPHEYASIVGGLMFAACVTRPDIMCAVGQLSQFLNNPSSKHLLAAKRVLRYLQGTSTYGIMYRPPPLRLQGYSDADWAGDIDTRRSTTGYIVMLNNGAIAWKSRRQPTVALSTMESEYMALTEATKELKWIRTLLAELGHSNGNSNGDEPPTDLFSDNQSAIALAKNPVSHARAKHIDIRHHFVREAIQDKVIWVQYIPTTEMTADSLTKALGREKHEKCTARMGMTP